MDNLPAAENALKKAVKTAIEGGEGQEAIHQAIDAVMDKLDNEVSEQTKKNMAAI